MRYPILRTLAIAAIALSLSGCSSIERTASGLLKLPSSLLDATARTVGNIGS